MVAFYGYFHKFIKHGARVRHATAAIWQLLQLQPVRYAKSLQSQARLSRFNVLDELMKIARFTTLYLLKILKSIPFFEWGSYIALMILLPLSILCLLIVIWSVRNGISPMPTSPKVKKALLHALPTVCSGNVLDLGSGWGTLAFPLAKKYPNCTVIGYETSPIPYYYSVIKRGLFGPSNLTFYRKDFFQCSYRNAALIVCYLYPKAMHTLVKKFKQEVSVDTLIVSHTFAIPGCKPENTLTVSDLYKTKIYFYSGREITR